MLNVKKEEVKSRLIRIRKSFGLVGIIFILIFSFMSYALFPRLEKMYETIEAVKPTSFSLFPFMMGSILLSVLAYSLYMLFTKPNVQEIDQKLQKYGEGDLVSLDEFSPFKPFITITIFLIITMICIVFGLIYPIYSISQQI